jgi:hypothetical protein
MLNKLLFLNISLLITHQIDAAYWHEWEMFKMPGGIQVYNLINLGLFAIVLNSIESFLRRTQSAFAHGLFLAMLSGLVAPIHAGFALAGYSQFHLPISIAVITALFFTSTGFAVALWRVRSRFSTVSLP